MINKIHEQVFEKLDLKLKDGARYHGNDYTKQEVEKAISRTIELVKEEFTKGRPCNICNQPDDYSDKNVCGNCIQKWKRVLENKQKADFKKMIVDYFKYERKILNKQDTMLPGDVLKYTGKLLTNFRKELLAKLGDDEVKK